MFYRSAKRFTKIPGVASEVLALKKDHPPYGWILVPRLPKNLAGDGNLTSVTPPRCPTNLIKTDSNMNIESDLKLLTP